MQLTGTDLLCYSVTTQKSTIERWILNHCTTSCWRHRTICFLIALWRHFQRFVDTFPFLSSATFLRFSCAHLLEITALWVFVFKLHAVNGNQLFSKNCKMLADDVLGHMWWLLMYCFLCMWEGIETLNWKALKIMLWKLPLFKSKLLNFFSVYNEDSIICYCI
jgi:hypothetical protein